VAFAFLPSSWFLLDTIQFGLNLAHASSNLVRALIDRYIAVVSFLTAVIGLVYPCVDSALRKQHEVTSATAATVAGPTPKAKRSEWSSVMRCIAVFVGINHASAVSFCSGV